MARADKSGIYKIECRTTGEFYIGSSRQVHRRWSQHRHALRKGISVCLLLQRAWEKYGDDSFEFSLIEPCHSDSLVEREQYFLDSLRPSLNIVKDATRHVTDQHIQKLVAFNKDRLAKITHCPRGHAYDKANTYLDKKGKRRCRVCNALRIAAMYAKQSESERSKRLKRNNLNYYKNHEANLKYRRKYTNEHKSEKREYDRRRRIQLKSRAT